MNWEEQSEAEHSQSQFCWMGKALHWGETLLLPQNLPYTPSNFQPYSQAEPWLQLLVLHKHQLSFPPERLTQASWAVNSLPETLTWVFGLPLSAKHRFARMAVHFCTSSGQVLLLPSWGHEIPVLLQPARSLLATFPPALYGIHTLCHAGLHLPECCRQGAQIWFIKASRCTFRAK